MPAGVPPGGSFLASIGGVVQRVTVPLDVESRRRHPDMSEAEAAAAAAEPLSLVIEPAPQPADAPPPEPVRRDEGGTECLGEVWTYDGGRFLP